MADKWWWIKIKDNLQKKKKIILISINGKQILKESAEALNKSGQFKWTIRISDILWENTWKLQCWLKADKKVKKKETHVCRHHSSRDSPVKRWKYEELSANTVAFISCTLDSITIKILKLCLQLMIRNVLTRRREYGTYLATARRHRRRLKTGQSSSTADEGRSAG